MTNSTDSTPAAPPTVPKKKGPIRWEAIIPFSIVLALFWAYFHFLFDYNLRKVLELGGYYVIGAEVDIRSLETSFWKGTLRIQGVELTDSEKPTHNMVEIGDIRFGVLWDGLLRAKLVINEMATENIQIGTIRKTPGKVKPIEKQDPNQPGFIETEGEKLKNKALDQTQEKYNENVLGDLASILGGTSGDDQLGKIEGSLESKAKIQELDKAFKEKSKAWETRFKTLPQGKEIQALGDRLSKVKTKDFKTPQELTESLKQFDEIIKEADQKYQAVQTAGNDLNSDYKNLDQGLKDLDAMVKKDIQDLETRFKIPKLDAKSISQGLFRPYIQPYLNKFNKYKAMADKYMPPNLKKKNKDEPETNIQPRPRAKGVSYEFGRQNSYPLFWIKKILVSSQAGVSAQAGNIEGLITDVTSNQVLTGKPTVATLKGGFPADEIADFKLMVSLDNTKTLSEIIFNLGVGSYPVAGRPVVQSPDVSLAFAKAAASLTAQGSLVGLRELKFNLSNSLNAVKFDVQAKNETVGEILKGIFDGIPVVNVNADISGTLPNFKADISSNLGSEIQKGFEKQVQKKIDEARQKIQAFVNESIGKEKAKLESEIAKFKSQFQGEIKKVQDQLNSQKAQAEGKINESKKRAEDQAKQGLQKEGQKAVDELKKKFGF